MLFRQLFDPESSTYTYLLADPETKEAVIIDAVREQAERDLAALAEHGLTLKYILDTHVHADHVTGAGSLRDKTGAKTVQSKRAGVECADVLVDDGDRLEFGRHALVVRATPGHTSGCVTYVTDDEKMAFTGDALLIRGTGRTDFQEGDARTLYRSIKEKIFTLPDDAVLYPGHDYQGRTQTTVAEEKAENARVGGGKTEDEFVEIMANLNLPYPKKIDVALPANKQCGAGDQSVAWTGMEKTAQGMAEVIPPWVEERLGKVRIIDVREPDEYTGPLGHIAGAESVPLATVESAAQSWPRDQKLVMVCRSGARSGKATLALMQMGFDHVVNMRGGMLAWNELGLEVVKGGSQ